MNNKDLVQFSNQLLSNLFIMTVKLRRYHWFVKGQHFFELHEQFEGMYTVFDQYIDELAERILSIDGRPFATMIKCLKEGTIEEATADDLTDEITDQLIADLTQICEEIKDTGYIRVKEVNDEPTLDLFISIQAKLELYIWMFKAFSRKHNNYRGV